MQYAPLSEWLALPTTRRVVATGTVHLFRGSNVPDIEC